MRIVGLAYAAGLLPAVVLGVAQPVWSRVDEAWHADVLAQYAHGVYPVLGVTGIRPEIQREMARTGVYRWDSFNSPPPDPTLVTVAPARHDLTPYERGVWARRHIWQYSYEALQPPLYYLAATPLWSAATTLGGTSAAILAVRLFNAALVALLAPLTLLLARELFPGRGDIAVGATAIAATVPGWALNASQITNDGAAAVLGATCLLLAARGIRRGWNSRSGALLGAVFGLGLLTKPNAVGLAAALAFALLRPPGSIRERWRPALAAGGAACLVVTPYLLINLALYRSLTTGPPGEALNSATVPWHLGAEFLVLNLIHLYATFWSGDQMAFTLRWAWPLVILLVPLTALAAAGVVRRLRETDRERAALTLPILAVAGATVTALALPLAAHNDYYSPGRYTYSALAAVAVLLSAGLIRELRGRLGHGAIAGMVAGGAAVILAYAALGPAPRPGTPTHPPAAAAVLALSGSGERSGLAVQVLEVRAGRDGAWALVSALNSAAQQIEWSPMPQVWVGGQPVADGIYAASDPFPEDLRPGQAVSGWIRLWGDQTRLESAASISFRFRDVAADDYHDVGDLAVTALRQ